MKDTRPATIRERIVKAVRGLPVDATVDAAIERIVFINKVEAGLARLDAGEGIPHIDVKRRLRG